MVGSDVRIGYLPYTPTSHSVEAGWVAAHLGLDVQVVGDAPAVNDGAPDVLPDRAALESTAHALRETTHVVAEGPGAFLAAAVLRAAGYPGSVTVLPYVNPRRWRDVAAVIAYRHAAAPGDRVLVGSTPSAAVYASLGLDVVVAEPYGIDDGVFRLLAPGERPTPPRGRLGDGPVLLYAGRAEADKDVATVLRVGLKAGVLFPGLTTVIATHVADEAFLAHAQAALGERLVVVPAPDRSELADLYRLADVVLTASTSHFETFGRAPAEALACGTPVVAPRYDGFAEVLAQPGGVLVDVVTGPDGAPRADEAALLRGVFDVLTTPRPPRPEQVSERARERFGRSLTIHALDHLAAGPTAQAPAPGHVEQANGPTVRTVRAGAAGPPLPRAWRAALGELSAGDLSEALAWLWRDAPLTDLATADADFALAVRRFLAAPDAGRLRRADRRRADRRHTGRRDTDADTDATERIVAGRREEVSCR